MKSVLIVEDDKDLRQELTDYLTSMGYTVQGVGTLAEADVALHRDISLLLLDIHLPDGSGLEFCERVRPYVRGGIVMMTGRSERELRIHGLKGGADAYLVKPLDPEELDATLQSVLRRAAVPSFSLLPVAPMPVQWRVDRVRQTLTAPNGRICKLSQTEALLLACLVQAQRKQVTRAALVDALQAQGIDSDSRRLETLVSRLRSKVQRYIERELPIQSIYGQGYAFADHALVI